MYMIKKIIALASCLASIFVFDEANAQSILLKDVVNNRYYARSGGNNIRSMKDGKTYTMMNDKANAIIRYSFETGNAIDTLFSIGSARDVDFSTFDDYIISDDAKQILLLRNIESIYRRSYKADVYHYEVSRRKVEALSEGKSKIMIPTFSPDGRSVAFVRDGNIFIKKFDYGTEAQVTNDAKYNHIMNGITDWVYEEEFSVTNLMSWSEDSMTLAYIKTNESAVKEVSMPIYGKGLYPTEYKYKYPKAGETNSTVSLHIYDLKMARSKEVEMSKLKNTSLDKSFANNSINDIHYIPRIEFVGDDLKVLTLNRRQNLLSIYSINKLSLIPKLILSEKDEAYIEADNIAQLQFLKNGFVFASERDGYNHLYLYNDKGVEQKKLTNGNWDITKFYGIDEKSNIYYQSADESPLNRNIYKQDIKGRKYKLGQGVGTNNAIFSSNFDYYISKFTDINTPMITAVYRSKDNKELRILENNERLKKEISNLKLPKKEFIKIQNETGEMLNAWIIKPKDFDANKKYPVLMTQYSGPNSQQVLNKFDIGWEYVLADNGYIVVCADARGTGARGAKWKKSTYMKLGVLESDDQIAVAKYLSKQNFVDASKIAIWGWSFGGYMTLMTMTRGNGIFAAGIAVAPVSDWAFYDSIYTERFMRSPQENPKGYEMSSALLRASKLKGDLFIIHGSADDNVHLQNTMRFTDILVQNNIAFEEAIYTNKDHGIYGGNTRLHLFTRMISFLDRKLKNK